MTVNLSIKNVPEKLTRKIKARAARNHRSLQGELMAILEASVHEEAKLSPQDIVARVRASGLKTAAQSVDFIREDRDARSRR